MTIYSTISSSPYVTSVKTLWEKLLPRLDLQRTSVDFLTCCNEVIEIITNHLWLRKSDLLRTTHTEALPASTNFIELPYDFIAVECTPVLLDSEGNTIKLVNLPKELLFDSSITEEEGVPEYFDLVGSFVYFYPAPEDAYTVKLEMYGKPAPLTSMSAQLPFAGMFNFLIGDNAVKISNLGYSILADQTFLASITTQVDRVINMRTKKDIYFKIPSTFGSQHSSYKNPRIF